MVSPAKRLYDVAPAVVAAKRHAPSPSPHGGGGYTRPAPAPSPGTARPLSSKRLPTAVGSDTIILQPGSLNVLYGLASDHNPRSCMNTIAWRTRAGVVGCGARGPPGADQNKSAQVAEETRQDGLAESTRQLQQHARQRPLVPHADLAQYNANSAPTEFAEEGGGLGLGQSPHGDAGGAWTDVSHRPEFVVGEEALHIHPDEAYEIRRPIKGGRANVSAHTPHAVQADLTTIWVHLIETQLGISRTDFESYKVVLLVEDVFKRRTVKRFMDILIDDLGFCAVMINVESVMTTFGAGLQSACVVDIGHNATSICCVDDGVSLPQTRIRLEFGGNDVVHALHWLLKQIDFPYKDCDLASAVDENAMREVAQRICHANLNDYSVLTQDMFVRKRTLVKYNFKVADQVITAPFGLFLPTLFGVPKATLAETQPDRDTLPEDAILGMDTDEYQIMRSTQNATRGDARGTSAAKSNSLAKQVGIDLHKSDLYADAALNNRASVSFVAVPTGQTSAPTLPVVGIDEAVAHSISLCSDEATRKNM